MEDHEKNNFSLGFVVGALVGVAGFFLTKTKEGKEVKKKVSEEWGSIKKKLEDEGIISDENKDFSEIILGVKSKIFKILKEEAPKKKRKTVTKPRKKKKKFKGI